MDNKLNIVPITAPSLSHSDYGTQIEKQFQNIDSNFKKILGTDFLKGNTGDSVHLIEVEFIENSNKSLGLYLNGKDLTAGDLYNLVKNAILNGIDEKDHTSNSLINVGDVTWKDSLKRMNKITFLYKTNDSEQRIIISSLYFTFLDERFSNIQHNDIASYEGAVDLSCILFIHNEQNNLVFDRINTFPTLYYDSNMISQDSTEYNKFGTFCWVINGNKTGIPATGPRGKTGKDNVIYVVKVDGKAADASNKHSIREVLWIDDTGSRFIPLNDFLKKDVNFQQGSFVMAINNDLTVQGEIGDWNEEGETHMWASPVIVEESEDADGEIFYNYYAYCDHNNSVLNIYNAKSILDAMGGIGYSEVLHGLIVPITESQTGTDGLVKQPAHMIFALPPVTGQEGLVKHNNLYIAPMDDLHRKPDPNIFERSWDDGEFIYEPSKSSISFLYNITEVGHNLKVFGSATIDGKLATSNNLEVAGGVVVNKLAKFNNESIFNGLANFVDDAYFQNTYIKGAIEVSGGSNVGPMFNIIPEERYLYQSYKANEIDIKDTDSYIHIYNGQVLNENQYVPDSIIKIEHVIPSIDNNTGEDEDEGVETAAEEEEAPTTPVPVINIYKDVNIYANADITGKLDVSSLDINQDVKVGEDLIVGATANIEQNLNVEGQLYCNGELYANNGLNADKDISLGGVTITNSNNDSHMDVSVESNFSKNINIGEFFSDGNEENEKQKNTNIILHPTESIDDVIDSFKISKKYVEIPNSVLKPVVYSPIITGIEKTDVKTIHNLAKNKSGGTSGITDTKTINMSIAGHTFNEGSSDLSTDNFSGFDPNPENLSNLWLHPLTGIDFNKFKDTASITVPYEGEFVIWENSSGENANEYRLRMLNDLTVLFTVSGRNLYSDPWFAKAVWTKPKWSQASMKVSLSQQYENSTTTTILADITSKPNLTLFNMSDTDTFENGGTAEKKGYGDTVLCSYSITPNSDLLYIDGSDLKKLTIKINVSLKFTRNKTNNEDKNNYETFRSVKILGILPSRRYSSGARPKILSRLYGLSGQANKTPLDNRTVKEQRELFDKLIIANKTDNIKCASLSYSSYSGILGNSTKNTGVYNLINSKETYKQNTIIATGISENDKISMQINYDKLSITNILTLDKVETSSSFSKPNTHVCNEGILMAATPENYSYIKSIKNDKGDMDVVIGAVKYLSKGIDGNPGIYKAETSLYDFLINQGVSPHKI